jgi:hypothetical protein
MFRLKRDFVSGFLFGCFIAFLLFYSLQLIYWVTKCEVRLGKKTNLNQYNFAENNNFFDSNITFNNITQNKKEPFILPPNSNVSQFPILNISSASVIPSFFDTNFTEEIMVDNIVLLVITGQNREQHIRMAAKTWISHIPESSVLIYSDNTCWDFSNCKTVGGAEEQAYIKKKVIAAFDDAYQRYPNKKWFVKVITFDMNFSFSHCLFMHYKGL